MINNGKYLAAGLSWLHLRLRRLAEVRASSDADGNVVSLSTPEIERAEKAMNAIATTKPLPSIVFLSQRLGLSEFEKSVLLLCAAMELDTSIAELCAQAQADIHKPYPTFALAFSLFDEPAWDVLSAQNPLRYWRLIEINQTGYQPLTTGGLRIEERIVNYLKGLNYLDERLTTLVMPLKLPQIEELPPSQQTVVEQIIHHLHRVNTVEDLPAIQLIGADNSSKQLIALKAAAMLGLQVYYLPSGLLPTSASELETFIRLWQRESILLPLALYLDARVENAQNINLASPLHRFLERTHSILFFDIYECWSDLLRNTVVIDISKPTVSEQQAAWQEALSPELSIYAEILASQFNLNLTTIEQNSRLVSESEVSNLSKEQTIARLWQSCLVSTRPRLDNLAQRIDAKATWNDLVLPKEEMGLLRQISQQVIHRRKVYEDWGFERRMNRGLGIGALFAGESGTGKTMGAEVIANSLQLNLYRIDLSSVVSKYIGETEKNLRRLFDAAEDGGVILFFDEADALFGKRSEVKDSRDRYANIEINYLLQRIEAYRGLAILATNMKSALDSAFMRRLRFIINFPFPNKIERQKMWQKVFPPETPIENLDFERLARLNLTGGSIHNIAINAAFLAISAETSITMPLLLTAVETELRKLEKPVNQTDFI